MTAIAIILLTLPLLYHLHNDRNGEKPEEKTKDIIVVSIIAIVAGIIGYLNTGKPIIDALLLAGGVHFMFFDYLINIILYRRGVIENPYWFLHLGKNYIDNVLRQWRPWTRFWVKVVILVVAVTIYIL